jgi:hypothetical protein
VAWFRGEDLMLPWTDTYMALDHLDDLIMLLSSDWFRSHWTSIGLLVDDEAGTCIQHGCRLIVKEVIGRTKEYYHIDFSDGRLERTRLQFVNLLGRCNVDAESARRITRLTSREIVQDVDEGTQWLLVTLSEQLINNSLAEDKKPAPAIAALIAGMAGRWTASAKQEIDVEGLCLISETEWDQYLKALTPSIPERLSNYALSIPTLDAFDVIREHLRTRLTPEQRAEVVAWYKDAGASLTGEALILPENL